MQFNKLSNEQKMFFEQNGYLIEKSVWSRTEIDALKQASRSFENYTNGVYHSLMNPHLTNSTFRNALGHPRVVQRLAEFFDGPVSAVQSQMFFGPPGCSGYSRHQDNFFVQTDPKFFISVWSSLDSADSANGGLIMYAGSHREPILDVREVDPSQRGKGQDPNSDRVESVFSENRTYPAIDLATEPGDIVYIHANVVHASYNNRTMDRFRNSLLCTYIRSGTALRKGLYAKREEIILKK